MNEDRSNIVWACPQCGYLVTDVVYLSIIFNAPCRCGQTKFSEFHSRKFPASRVVNDTPVNLIANPQTKV